MSSPAPPPASPTLALQPDAIVATADRLLQRVAERFPERGIRRVASDLAVLTRAHGERAARIRRPAWGIRAGIAALVLACVALVVALANGLGVERLSWRESSGPDLLQSLEAALGMALFVGAALVFLVSMELRVKRRRALEALHELRALAHVIDMHQLTKDPDRSLGRLTPTASSPKPDLTPAELARYLDYCSEMLSLIGKVAATYVQAFPDPVAVSAVDDVESLTNGLSGRIWQKIMVLDTWQAAPRPPREPGAGETPLDRR